MGRILLPVLLLMLAVAASVLSDRPAPPADFAFINRGDVNILDPQRMSWMQDLRVARLVFEPLVRNDTLSRDFDVIPGVAERWDISEDQLVYTFHLRPDAKWTNGSPVTAHDFIYAWRRILLPDIAGDYFKLFTKIVGGQQFYDWRQEQLDNFDPAKETADALWQRTIEKFDELVGVHAIDSRTLEVRLERPTPYFLDIVAFIVAAPVYPPLVSKYEKPDPRTGALNLQLGWTKPGVLVGNGPFELVTWRFKRDMRFETNPHYWDKDNLAIRSIAIPSVNDANAQVLAFDSGAVDWVSDITPSYRSDMLAAKQQFYNEHAETVQRMREQGYDPIEIDRALPPDPRKNIHAFPAFGTYFYNFNCLPRLPDGRENPFADARVRRAFSLAIDKRRITDTIRRIGEQPTATLIPRDSLAGYTSPQGLGFDPAAARQLLAEAGYPNGRGLPTIRILFNKEGGHDIIAQSAAKDWEDHLGVSVALDQKEIKVFREDLKEHNFMIARAGWFGDYGDPTTYLDINRTGDGNNDRAYSSEHFDGLLDAAENELDPVRRMEILSEAERWLVEVDLPLIPVFQYALVYQFNPDRVSGISSHPRGQQDLFRVDILGDGIGPDIPKAIPRLQQGQSAGYSRTAASTNDKNSNPDNPDPASIEGGIP